MSGPNLRTKDHKAAWRELLRLGAHIVPIGGDGSPNQLKRPLPRFGWKEKPTAESLIDVRRNPNLRGYGVVPASIGFSVLDIDEQTDEGIEALRAAHPPAVAMPSLSGNGRHFWYRDTEGRGNGQWAAHGCRGDVRSANGYVIPVEPWKLVEALQGGESAGSPFPADLASKPKGYEPGNRNNTVNLEAYKAGQRGDRDAARQAAENAIEAGLPPDEARDTAARAFQDGQRDATGEAFAKDGYELHRALRALGVEYRFNERLQNFELRRGGGQWAATDDFTEDNLRAEISSRFSTYSPVTEKKYLKPLTFAPGVWTEKRNAVCHGKSVDCFALWLDTLPAWDGTARIEGLIETCFDLEDESAAELARWGGKALLLGAVWRTYRPGTKLDETLVVVGDGGIGKSTLPRMLFPAGKQSRWFGDSLAMDENAGRQIESMAGRVIVEMAEMRGIGRVSLESLKAFLSRQEDQWRLAWKRNLSNVARRCVFYGTADKREALPNDHNNRRFVAIGVLPKGPGNAGRIRAWLTANRNQLWAEALALYRQGAEAWLPANLGAAQTEANEQFRAGDTLEDKAAMWIRAQVEAENMPPWLADDVQRAMFPDFFERQPGGALPRGDQTRLGRVMKHQGFEKKRVRFAGEVGTARKYCYARAGGG